MKTILFALLVVMFIPLTAYSQGDGIFLYLDQQSLDLTDRQQELLDVIQSWPQTKQVWLISFDETQLDMAKQVLQLNMPKHIIDAEKTDTGTLNSWGGKINGINASTILLNADNDDLIGYVQTDEFSYSIRPLTGGIQALIELDPTKFDKEAPPIIPSDSFDNWNYGCLWKSIYAKPNKSGANFWVLCDKIRLY